MSTFSQWWVSFQKNPKPKKITWVCGSETVLVDEVVDKISEVVSPDPLNVSHVNAETESRRDVWNRLRQLPFGTEGNRLTVVRDAQALLEDPQFLQYANDVRSYPRNYVILVSSEEGLRRAEGRTLDPALEGIKSKASLVECQPFTQRTAKHAVAWVQEKGNIRTKTAEHLLNRSTGNLRVVRDTLSKLKVFDGEISLRVVNEMFEERPSDEFLSALFSLNKKTALLYMDEILPSEYSKLIGLIDARLDLAGRVHDMQVEYKSPGEIAKAAGSMSFLVPEILPVAKHYDKKRRMRIRQYLAMIDGYSDVGAPPKGTLEAIIGIW